MVSVKTFDHEPLRSCCGCLFCGQVCGHEQQELAGLLEQGYGVPQGLKVTALLVLSVARGRLLTKPFAITRCLDRLQSCLPFDRGHALLVRHTLRIMPRSHPKSGRSWYENSPVTTELDEFPRQRFALCATCAKRLATAEGVWKGGGRLRFGAEVGPAPRQVPSATSNSKECSWKTPCCTR